MNKSDIIVGGLYRALVSGRVVTVRVDSVRQEQSVTGRAATSYHVTNLGTGRALSFRSAARFRGPAKNAGGDTVALPW